MLRIELSNSFKWINCMMVVVEENDVRARPPSRTGCKTPLLTPRCQRKARINFRQRAEKLRTPDRSLHTKGGEKPPIPSCEPGNGQNSQTESRINQTSGEHEPDQNKLPETDAFCLKRPSEFIKK